MFNQHYWLLKNCEKKSTKTDSACVPLQHLNDASTIYVTFYETFCSYLSFFGEKEKRGEFVPHYYSETQRGHQSVMKLPRQ